MVHPLAQAAVEIVELLFKGKVALFQLSALGVQLLQNGVAGAERGARGFDFGVLCRNLLALGADFFGISRKFVMQNRKSFLRSAAQGGFGFNILLRFARADIKLGQFSANLLFLQNGLAVLGGLFGAEICKFADACGNCFFLRRQGGKLFLVSGLRFFQLSRVRAQLFQERVVGVQLCAQLFKSRRLVGAQNGDQLLAVLGGVLCRFFLFKALCQLGCLFFPFVGGNLQLFQLFFQPFHLAGAGKNAGAGFCGTTGKGTANVDLLTVQRDNTHAVALLFCHDVGMVDSVKHHRSAQQGGQDVFEFSVGFDKRIGNSDVTRVASRRFHFLGGRCGLHRCQREKCRAASLAAFEREHGGFCGGFILYNNVLQVGSQRNLHGGDVAVLHRDDLGKRTVNFAAGGAGAVGDFAVLILIHYIADGAGVALKMLLHRLHGGNSLRNRIYAQFCVCAFGLRRVQLLRHCLNLLFGIGNSGVGIGDFGVISGNGALLDAALLFELFGGFTVALQFLQNTGIFAGVGFPRVFQNRNADADVGCLGFRLPDAGQRIGNGVGKIVLLLQQRVLLGGQCLALFFLTSKRVFQFADFCGVRGAGFLLGANGFFNAGDRALRCGNQILGVGNGGFGNALFAFQTVAFLGLLLNLAQELFGFQLSGLRSLKEFVVLRFQGLNPLLGALQIERRMVECFFGGFQFAVDFFGIVKPDGNVGALFILHQGKRFFRFFGFFFQGTNLRRNLGENIVDPCHIFFYAGKLTLGFILTVAVFGNSRRVLEYAAALLALAGDHFGNFALPDDGIAVAADTGVHKQLVYIFQADCLTVDEVFAVPGAVIAARDGYFIIGTFQLGKILGVIKGNGNLGISHWTATVGTAENNVLHFASAQAFGRDFAQNPAHCVGNIGFSRTVRPDDDGDAFCFVAQTDRHFNAVIKHQFGFVGKGLEALHFQ